MARVLTDNDISASGYSRKRRPGYEALLEMIKAGGIDVVAVWDLDRLCRRPIEQEAFYDLAAAANVVRLVTRGEDFNLGESLVLPRAKAAIAAEESRKLSSRIRSKHAELIAQGAPSGGSRPFGLSDIERDEHGRAYRRIVADEAEAVRQAAKDIIEGVSVRSICRRWEAMGFRGTRGGPVVPSFVSRIMTSEWVVARRGGKPTDRWPAILDDETWRVVSAVIKGRASGRSYPRNLLSGIAVCGLCGHQLVSRPKGDGRPAYVCAKDSGGCGKIGILAKDFEEDVLGRLFSRIDPARLHQPPGDDAVGHELAELERLEGLRRQLAELAGAGELDLSEFRAAKAANDHKINELRKALARSAEEESQKRARAEAIDLWDKWDDLDINNRRRVVKALAERIEVGQRSRGGTSTCPSGSRSPTARPCHRNSIAHQAQPRACC